MLKVYIRVNILKFIDNYLARIELAVIITRSLKKEYIFISVKDELCKGSIMQIYLNSIYIINLCPIIIICGIRIIFTKITTIKSYSKVIIIKKNI